jgi:hypothetical protein
MAELPKTLKPIADHLIDFEIPLYNVWNYSSLPKAQLDYPGAIPRGEMKGFDGWSITDFELANTFAISPIW